MSLIQKEISTSVINLGLGHKDIFQLDRETARNVYFECLTHFVKSGDRRWWWEDFKQQSFSIDEFEHPYQHLDKIIPDLNNRVWLMVEDGQEDFFPVYDCNPGIIKSLIGECSGFEYYIISKDKKWLICENHHSVLIGAGEFPK